jgi:class 3 adenylate cyclase
MYAAARFNAFIVAQSTGSAEKMRGEKAQALEYFVNQFRMMMENNLDDFAANFDKYIGDAARSS